MTHYYFPVLLAKVRHQYRTGLYHTLPCSSRPFYGMSLRGSVTLAPPLWIARRRTVDGASPRRYR